MFQKYCISEKNKSKFEMLSMLSTIESWKKFSYRGKNADLLYVIFRLR